MYLQHFQLTEAPFSIAPNPRYLYLSQRHQEALAHLLYGIRGEGGFVLLTGAIGAGKTTVCRCLLEQLPEHCEVAYIFNPKLSVTELLATICHEFGIDHPENESSVKRFVDLINDHLLERHAQGKNSVLIIDEAQNLAPDVLEQMRLLTNLETNERKLLQIILIGQPELAALLDRPGLTQLAQRIVARYHLEPLSRHEIATYVQHRLAVSGTQHPLIPPKLAGLLHHLTGGVPRLINVLCDRALLGAYTQGKSTVDRATLLQAARETLSSTAHQPRSFWPAWLPRISWRGEKRSSLSRPSVRWALLLALLLFLTVFLLLKAPSHTTALPQAAMSDAPATPTATTTPAAPTLPSPHP